MPKADGRGVEAKRAAAKATNYDAPVPVSPGQWLWRETVVMLGPKVARQSVLLLMGGISKWWAMSKTIGSRNLLGWAGRN